MWVPRNSRHIEQAARAGELPESPSFDAKADLPQPREIAALAVDVAAMASDGGVLLYGVGEDEKGRPTVPTPIDLSGAGERIARIVATSITEVPYIDVREYATDADPSKGYILVIVPQSARAPHQVAAGGDLRFYGRGVRGNRVLTEGEVARLYQRRQAWEQDRDALLMEAVEAARFPASPALGYVHGFVRPVAPDRSIWDRAVASFGGPEALQEAMKTAAAGPVEPRRDKPEYWRRQGADAWRLSSQREESPALRLVRYVVNFMVNVDGRGHLFDGGATRRVPRQNGAGEARVIFETGIAASFAGFLAFIGVLYRAAGYFGRVDVGLKVTGLEGGHSATLFDHPDQPFAFRPPDDRDAFNEPAYSRTSSLAAAELDEPHNVAGNMLRPLFEATTLRDDFDPFRHSQRARR
jgi:hypothetical protein